MDLVRTRFAIDAGEAQRLAQLLCGGIPAPGCTLCSPRQRTIQTTLDRVLGRTHTGLEARDGELSVAAWRGSRHASRYRKAGKRSP